MKVPLATIGLLLLSTGCGLFSAPPGEAACNKFSHSVIDWRQRDQNFFEFRENLNKVQKKAASAEPEIQVAANKLARSANTVSEERLKVSIEIMEEACIKFGYLEPHTF